MNDELLQFDVPEETFIRMSKYLHEMMLAKEYVKQQVPYEIIFPESVVTYPENRIIVEKARVPKQRLSDCQEHHPGRFFKIARELLSYFIVLHRAFFDVPTFSLNEVFLDEGGAVIIDLVPNDLRSHFHEAVQQDYCACNSLISDIFFHASQSINMDAIISTLTALTNYFFQVKIAEELISWYSNAMSAAQLLAIICFLEYATNDQKQDYYEISFTKDVLNSFQALFIELENEVASFIRSSEFESIIQHVMLNTLAEDAVEERMQEAIHSSSRVFLGYELKGQSSKLILSVDEVLYESPIEPKVMRIRESKYQQIWVERLIEKYFSTAFNDVFVIVKLESTDEIVELICTLVKNQSERSIFTKTTNLHNILEHHLLETDSKDAQTARDIAAMERPSEEQIQTYQAILTKFEAEYIKIMHNSALYLGQVFPQLLEVFNLQPDPELTEFDCMDGGRFLLTLFDHLIRPDEKILYIFDESFFITNAQTDLNDNILISMLLNYNHTNTFNSTLLHFQQFEQYAKEEQRYRFEILRKILKEAKIMSFEHILQEKVLSDDFQGLMVRVTGRKQNAYDVLTAANCLIEQQCRSENYFCKYSQLYDYIERSGFYYVNIEEAIERYGRELFKFPDAELMLQKAAKQVEKILGISLDYFSIAKPCKKQHEIYFKNMTSKFHMKLELDILYIFAISTETIELDQLAHIFNVVPGELQPVCENLVALRFITKVATAAYCVADLDLAACLVKQYDGENYQYQLNRLFWLNVSRYQVECREELAQCRLFSELLRQYYCIVQTKESNYVVRRNSVIMHESSFEQLDDISFSLISKLDNMLSLSEHSTQSSSSIEDSDEFYAEYGIFKHTSDEGDDLNSGAYLNRDLQQKERQITTELVKIKACLLLVGCLNARPRADVEVGIFLENGTPNNSYQISCILSTTAHYISEVKQLCEDQQQHSEYLEVAKALETSCIIYYFVNVPTTHSMALVEELVRRPISNASKAMIGWRMLRCGNVRETSNYAIAQLGANINYQELELLIAFFREFQHSETKFDSLMYVINITTVYYNSDKSLALSAKHSFLLIAEVLLVANRLLCNEPYLLGACLKLLQIAIEQRISCAVLDICYLVLLDWACVCCSKIEPLLEESLRIRYFAMLAEIWGMAAERTPEFMQNGNLIKQVCMSGHKDLDAVTNKMLTSCPAALYFDPLFHDTNTKFEGDNDLLRMAFKISDFDFNKHVMFKLLGNYFLRLINDDRLQELTNVHQCAELLIRVADSSEEANMYSIVAQIIRAFDSGPAELARPSRIVIGRGQKDIYRVLQRLLAGQIGRGRVLLCSTIVECFYRPYCAFRGQMFEYFTAARAVPRLVHSEPLELHELLCKWNNDKAGVMRMLVLNGALDRVFTKNSVFTAFADAEGPVLPARMARERDVSPREFEQFIYYWVL